MAAKKRPRQPRQARDQALFQHSLPTQDNFVPSTNPAVHDSESNWWDWGPYQLALCRVQAKPGLQLDLSQPWSVHRAGSSVEQKKPLPPHCPPFGTYRHSKLLRRITMADACQGLLGHTHSILPAKIYRQVAGSMQNVKCRTQLCTVLAQVGCNT